MAIAGDGPSIVTLPTENNTADELRAALQAECEVLDAFVEILDARIKAEQLPAVQSWLAAWKSNLITDRQAAEGYLGDLDAGGGNTDTADAELTMIGGLLSVASIYQKVSAGANDPRLDEMIQAWVADLQDSNSALATIRRILAQ